MSADKLNIAYFRLSKEDGDSEIGSAEESCSISSQRTCVSQYIHEHFGSDFVVEEIVDDGFSGTNMLRPGMQRLLQLVREGRVQTIIVRDLSRFARNYLEAGHYLEFVFPVNEVRFISINDRFDSGILVETTGGLELAVRNLLNEMYSKDISRKIKSVVDMKKLNGEYVYGTAPYGYKKGEKKNTIVLDEEAAGVVKKIFSLAADGATVTQIAGKLNESQTVTPSVYLSGVRGKYPVKKFWTYDSVRNILTNRIYTGDTEAFKSHVVKVGSDLVKQIPPEQRRIIPCTHEAIVSREQYFEAQKTIKSVKKAKHSAIANPMTSLLVCGCCGNRLIKGKEKNKYWLCASARYKSGLGCEKIRISDEKVQQIVLNAILYQCRLLDAKVQEINMMSSNEREKQDLLYCEQKNTQKKIARLNQEKMRLYEDYATGILSKESYLSKKDKASAEMENLKIQMRLISKKISDIEKETQSMQEQMENAKQVTSFGEITRLTSEITKELIKKIVVFADGTVKIEWNFSNEIERFAK